MIAGLPATSWLLIIVAVGAGLVLEMAFLRAHGGRLTAAETELAAGAAENAGAAAETDREPGTDGSRRA